MSPFPRAGKRGPSTAAPASQSRLSMASVLNRCSSCGARKTRLGGRPPTKVRRGKRATSRWEVPSSGAGRWVRARWRRRSTAHLRRHRRWRALGALAPRVHVGGVILDGVEGGCVRIGWVMVCGFGVGENRRHCPASAAEQGRAPLARRGAGPPASGPARGRGTGQRAALRRAAALSLSPLRLASARPSGIVGGDGEPGHSRPPPAGG